MDLLLYTNYSIYAVPTLLALPRAGYSAELGHPLILVHKVLEVTLAVGQVVDKDLAPAVALAHDPAMVRMCRSHGGERRTDVIGVEVQTFYTI